MALSIKLVRKNLTEFDLQQQFEVVGAGHEHSSENPHVLLLHLILCAKNLEQSTFRHKLTKT
jgi:hypothetical protein